MKKLLTRILYFLMKHIGDEKILVQFTQDENVDDAIAIAGKIKEAVETPVVVMTLMAFLPERIHNTGGENLRRVESSLHNVLAAMVPGSVCINKATLGERMRCFVENVKTLSPAMQEATYLKFASLYVKYASNVYLPNKYFDTQVQLCFFQQAKK